MCQYPSSQTLVTGGIGGGGGVVLVSKDVIVSVTYAEVVLVGGAEGVVVCVGAAVELEVVEDVGINDVG